MKTVLLKNSRPNGTVGVPQVNLRLTERCFARFWQAAAMCRRL